MADTERNTTPLPKPNSFYRGTLIADLQETVERTETNLENNLKRTILETRPLLTVGQIRLLLRVVDSCEECSGEGTIYTVGQDPTNVTPEKCTVCKGRGYNPVEEPTVTQ